MSAAVHVPSKDELLTGVEALRGKRVVVVGDAMVDTYVAGKVERISPEAPVPVVRVDREWDLLGGAGNVARNVASLGGSPTLVCLTGQDRAAERLDDLLRAENIGSALVRDAGRPTTIKTRVIAANQQVCRVDREDASPLSETLRDELLATVERSLMQSPAGDETPAGAIIVSDYGKGVVDREFMAGLMALVGARTPRPFVLVDPVPQHYEFYLGADLITPNAKEAGAPGGMAGKSPQEGKGRVLRAGLKLFRTCKLRHVLITLGPDGMALFQTPDQVLHLPTFARKVFDVTGAGDTVISVMGLAMAAGLPLLDASVLANHAAGLVVAQVGSAAVSPDELSQALDAAPAPRVERWL